MKEDIELCSFSGENFRPPCPVTDCPAWFGDSKTKCVFLEVGKGKTKLTKVDISVLFKIDEKRADKLIKEAKKDLNDAAKIIISLLRTQPKGKPLEIRGEFFENLNMTITQSQIDHICKDKTVKAALRRRMLPGQFSKFVKARVSTLKRKRENEIEAIIPSRHSENTKRRRFRGRLGFKPDSRDRGHSRRRNNIC